MKTFHCEITTHIGRLSCITNMLRGFLLNVMPRPLMVDNGDNEVLRRW